MREKLIELLMDMPFGCSTYEEEERHMEDLADYLIANGVTFAKDNDVPNKWIPVTERLPDMRHDVLVSRTWWNKRKPAQIGWYNEVTGNWYILTENGQVMDNKVTHWMPLPQPPKEG